MTTLFSKGPLALPESADPRSPRALPLPLPWLLLVALLAMGAHAATLGNGLVFDDHLAIEKNPVVQGSSPATAAFTRDYWGRAPGAGPGTWRPLPVLSFRADRAIGGGRAWPFHLGNLLWHMLACLGLALALASRGLRPATALLAGATIGVLAGCSEAVHSVVGRADLMAAAGCFWAWWLCPAPSQARGGPWRISLACLAFGLALLSKESSLVFPLWLLAVDRLLTPAGTHAAKPWAPRYLALAATAIAVWALRWGLYGPPLELTHRFANNNPLIGASLSERLATAPALLTLALRQLVAPFALSADYSFAQLLPAKSLFNLQSALGLGLLLGLPVGIWLARRREPTLAAGLALFGISWLVVGNLLVLLPTIFAERLLYLPAAGFALVLAWAAERLWLSPKRWLAVGLVLAVLPMNLAQSASRAGDWKSDLSLFAATVKVAPRSARAWAELGAARQRAGRHANALTALTRASKIAPKWSWPHTLAGVSHSNLGQNAKAERSLRRALRLEPKACRNAVNLAVFYARHRHFKGAIGVLTAHLNRHPCPQARALLRRMQQDLQRSTLRRPR